MSNLVERNEHENGYNPYGNTPEGFETKPVKEHPEHPEHPVKPDVPSKDSNRVKKTPSLIRKFFGK